VDDNENATESVHSLGDEALLAFGV